MGFRDRFKKVFGQGKKEDEETVQEFESSDESVFNDEEPVEKISDEGEVNDSPIQDNIRNFKYLDDLIHSGIKVIVLDSDIVFDDVTDSNYVHGIDIDVDDLVIDGNDHTIDAREKTRIFKIYGKNVTLFNIEFVNGSNDNEGSSYGRTYDGKISYYGHGGALYIDSNSTIKIESCIFKSNSSDNEGGAIFNDGNCIMFQCKFLNNVARYGGALSNGFNGFATIKKTIFKENNSNRIATILNEHEMIIEDSKFISNTAYMTSTVITDEKAILNLKNCDFISNSSQIGPVFTNFGKCIIKNSNFSCHDNTQIDLIVNGKTLEIFNSNFSDNKNKFLIANKSKVNLFESNFERNMMESILYAEEGSMSAISNVKFIENKIVHSTIHNMGESNISDSKFDNNRFGQDEVIEFYNESDLNLKMLKFKDIASLKSIFNTGYMKIRGLNESELNELIKENRGKIEIIEFNEKIESNQFTCLDNLIHNSENNYISLENDFLLNEFERLFYEGGIELDIDKLTINGNGNVIDADNKSRIFVINANNVVLENIIFKNGMLSNTYENFNDGGGVLKILKGSSLTLKNCKFIDSNSNKNGGAILNHGVLNSINNSFENNKSKYYGGSICNRGICTTDTDNFDNNSSKLGEAIYNIGELEIRNITVSNNNSLEKPIFNSNLLKTIDDFDFNDLIHNIGNVNKIDNHKKITFKEFGEKLKGLNNADYLKLDYNVQYNHKTDSKILKELLIDCDELIIDGLDNSIDWNNNEFSINITGNNVTFKNITFKNANLRNRNAIKNNGNITFENCKFISNISTEGNVIIFNDNSINVVRSILFNNISNANGIISNNSQLKIEDSKIINNFSDNASCIFNSKQGDLKLIESTGISNSSKSNGGLIGNFGSLYIDDSEFIYNLSDIEGGVIYNDKMGISTISNSKFINNSANGSGVILNEGIAELKQSSFIQNKSLNFHSGGVLLNLGDLKIIGSNMNNNYAKKGGCIENGFGGTLRIFNTEFFENNAVNGAVIVNYDDVKLVNCKIYNNISKNGGVIASEDDAIFNHASCIFGNNSKGDFNKFTKW